MDLDILSQEALFHIGPLEVTATVTTTWGIMALLGMVSWLLTRKLSDEGGPLQTAVEGAVEAIHDSVEGLLPTLHRTVLPLIGTLWIFLVTANLTGIVPGLHSPTRDLSATAAFAVLVFFSVHWFGIRNQGLPAYLRHYLKPTPMLLPFHIISELTRTLALAVRLFGNMMSLELTALMILMVAGFLAPVPILMLHIVEALVQAYIFGMLALIYIAGGISVQTQPTRSAS